MIRGVPAVIIFGEIHFLLTSKNEFFHEIKRNGITSLHGIHEMLFIKIGLPLFESIHVVVFIMMYNIYLK